jgi:hypothetical protein
VGLFFNPALKHPNHFDASGRQSFFAHQNFKAKQQGTQWLTQEVRNALNKFCIASYRRFQPSVQLAHSFLVFLNELDGCFNNDVVEKTFHNSPRGILRVKIETDIYSGEGFKPSVSEVPTNQADLAD